VLSRRRRNGESPHSEVGDCTRKVETVMDQPGRPNNGAVSDVTWRHAPSSSETPLCYLVDREPGVRRLVTSLLERCRVDVEIFDTLADMPAAPRSRDPDLVLIDVTVGAPDALELVGKLATSRIACPVQILSGLSPLLVEQVRRHGERGGLQMLPVMHKPLQSSALRRTITGLGLRRDPQAAIRVGLEEVLAEGWFELWYQPTINLKHRNLVGAEAFVRARHPEHGVLPPEAFLNGASEKGLLDLTRRVLGRALQDWPAFATIGVPIELSINTPLVALTKLSIFGIMWEEKPDAPQWPGLTLEISEDEAVGDVALLKKAIAELRSYGISVAVDNFGPRYAEFSRFSELPFSEIKIDRSYIASCDSDPVNKGLCETIVEFANHFRLTSSAEGIETTAELNTLREIGCERGQGYLFSRPLPKNELIDLLRQRSKARTAA
jgi:EAL domain-containing protein (putative c-di-GMP-specific phosphodiesterase class I)